MLTCYAIAPHWHDTGSWNPSSCKTMIYLFYMFNIMAADGLATQGDRASATMIFDMLNRIDSVPARWGSICLKHECVSSESCCLGMMTSSAFSALLALCEGEFNGPRWIPLTKARDGELWCFLWSAPKQMVVQTIETPVIWDAITERSLLIGKKYQPRAAFWVIYTENCGLSWGQLWRHLCKQRLKSWHYNNSRFSCSGGNDHPKVIPSSYRL